MAASLPVTSRVCWILGHPVSRSISPAIHNAAFAACGLDWRYEPRHVAADGLARAIEEARALPIAGANVTIPHKEAVIGLLDGTAGDAEAFGAVNTIVPDRSRLVGHNTDGAGFLRFLRQDAGIEPAGLSVTLLGAGGSARAVAGALARAGARVVVAARRPEQARAVAAVATASEGTALEQAPVEVDVLVNATPVRSGLPVDAGRARVVVDLRYHLPPSDLVARARSDGRGAYDGLGMLVHQAALSFEMWTNRAAPLEVMRAAALAAQRELREP